MTTQEKIEAFLAGGPHAVVGASRDRQKFGNKVLRCYMQHDMPVYPVNPHEEEIEGLRAVADLVSLPEAVHGVSIVTPPHITERIVRDAIAQRVRFVWMQPGAESGRAIALAEEAGLVVLAGGPCVLVSLGFEE